MKPSRRTITTPNRFIIYTRSWRASILLAAFSCLLVLLFSCTDDASLVGFKKDPKLKTGYVEIPLDYSMIMHEPIPTQNLAAEEINRLLVGRVSDPDFGELEAISYFNFSPPIDFTVPPITAQFESIELVLKFDYYSFGATDSSELQLSVHELVEPLSLYDSYHSRSFVPYQVMSVGDTAIWPGPVLLKEGWEKASDNNPSNNAYFSETISLASYIGQNLLDDLINNSETILADFNLFSVKYPGFAVRMPSGNKILGFTPVYTLPTPSVEDSRIVLRYSDNGTQYAVDFPIYFTAEGDFITPVASFTYLNANRTGTPLDGILPFVDFTSSNGNLYAQSGIGIMPKFDFTKVYDYFDTIQDVVINMAELEIENSYTGRTPQVLEFLLLNDQNLFRPITYDSIINGTKIAITDPYLLKIQSGIVPLGEGLETRVAALNQLTGSTVTVDQTSGSVGSTIFTEFFQQIITYKDAPNRARSFALHPVNNEFYKSVSILKLDPSSAKLKIYYSVPLTSPINTSP